MKINKLCPYPWLQLSVEPNGNLRFCCYGESGKDLLNEEGKLISINDVNSVQEVLNHPTYKSIRLAMLKQEYPDFCKTCLKIEQKGGESPRTAQIPLYQNEFTQQVESMQVDGSVELRLHTLELTLGNICNLKCRMCSPFFSTLLKSDFDQMNFDYNREEVSQIENFWQMNEELNPFLRDALLKIKKVNFLGGEPLLAPVHAKILKFLIERKRASEVTLFYNTNLTIASKTTLDLWSQFKHIHLDVSLEGTAEINDYIRKGSDFKKIDRNIELVKSSLGDKVDFNICTVLQALNFEHIPQWLDFLMTWKSYIPKLPNFIYLDFPSYLSAKVLAPKLRGPIIQMLRSKIAKYQTLELSDVEKMSLRGLIGFIEDLESSQWDEKGYLDFVVFNKKLDKLRQEQAPKAKNN
ncbi:MAG: hypothetical protein COW00_02195 [Bdellovibrio sp. CG12_big_fil_rev_8_21_14_0_65_39_13]|nr:MAG: hypothetical protein COW78_14450 [Bdellovibrio sp. CG22_combo_CG10-13_8_21_14_all_39_27]PIQ62193.1 MAG: hypothetical protein COW00_02195 [Bdellovibrio sp. CG12_big_fil_rev_8_21_14_0_65_39_13]PIR34203.1 MAG: hypothetical protein COV37_13940 [Bdellovibrio sp. CG11_big_fil_rev_8_21_14_0_20_39_38]